jgi:hypothetical protein
MCLGPRGDGGIQQDRFLETTNGRCKVRQGESASHQSALTPPPSEPVNPERRRLGYGFTRTVAIAPDGSAFSLEAG